MLSVTSRLDMPLNERRTQPRLSSCLYHCAHDSRTKCTDAKSRLEGIRGRHTRRLDNALIVSEPGLAIRTEELVPGLEVRLVVVDDAYRDRDEGALEPRGFVLDGGAAILALFGILVPTYRIFIGKGQEKKCLLTKCLRSKFPDSAVWHLNSFMASGGVQVYSRSCT